MHRQEFPTVLIVVLIIVLLTLTLASPAWAAEYKVLYKFQGGTDGKNPYASLIFDAAGNLYGTTWGGGGKGCPDSNGCGVVFELTPNPDGSWSENIIHRFSGMFLGGDGAYSSAPLTFDGVGNLYGTTSGGGGSDEGTAFKLTPNPDGTWSESVLYSFASTNEDGDSPSSGLIFDVTGNLYGTTTWGGDYGHGAVFKLTPDPDGTWSESVIYSFNSSDGWYPHPNSAIFDPGGNLYGTTLFGGARRYGTVFKLTPRPDGTWSESIIYTFAGRNGREPSGGLSLDVAGNLYGTTVRGGAYHEGTSFKLTPNPDGNWTRSKLHVFRGPDGGYPYAGLVPDAAGNLYGTTSAGGAYDEGTLFQLSPNPDGSWTRNKLHVFKGQDGAHPYPGLIFDSVGSFYGTTYEGGNGYGVVFKITP